MTQIQENQTLMDQMKCKFSFLYFYLVLSMHEAAWGRKKLE